MTKSSAWGTCAPLRGRLWRQGHGLSGFPSGISPSKSASVYRGFGRGQIHDCRRAPEASQIAVHQSVEKIPNPSVTNRKRDQVSKSECSLQPLTLGSVVNFTVFVRNGRKS